MTASVFSFIVWSGFMVAMLVGLGLAARRGRARSQQVEDLASKILPELGRMAERTHSQRFGAPPEERPALNGVGSSSWYPPAKHRAMKHG